MKTNIILSAAALALLGAVSANAQITLTLTGPTGSTPTFAQADQRYDGIITNTTSSLINIDGATYSSASGTVYDVLGDFTKGSVPLTLAAGASSSSLEIFDFASVTGSAPYAKVQLYGETNYDPNSTTQSSVLLGFAQIGTPPGSNGAVPEPGSIALLMGGLVSGGLFAARRRK